MKHPIPTSFFVRFTILGQPCYSTPCSRSLSPCILVPTLPVSVSKAWHRILLILLFELQLISPLILFIFLRSFSFSSSRPWKTSTACYWEKSFGWILWKARRRWPSLNAYNRFICGSNHRCWWFFDYYWQLWGFIDQFAKMYNTRANGYYRLLGVF